MKYIPHKDKKEFAKDLKAVYGASTADMALENLYSVREKWGDKYPNAIRSWEQNWGTLCTIFGFPPQIRKIIYTTNVIESLHRQYRKATKTKSIFPSNESLQKMLYLVTMNVTKKWTMRYPDWDRVLMQLSIIYKDKLKGYIAI